MDPYLGQRSTPLSLSRLQQALVSSHVLWADKKSPALADPILQNTEWYTMIHCIITR